ncbi:FAD:protein FMN transferase [Motiliproteus sp. MSK22-1]|uniref:FAD:protein FMN transferase n=1 Tax=Motiliproteus sp. MSK22-1 TaxID=1897630 RepID=UPI0009765F7D|nr:FAD:protein FMN transferase [Motiliproteus sp. MSK22-1]OMH33701.1 hypothetical protein BGP75_11900 [Motiliproteus sp. MSK22-1]
MLIIRQFAAVIVGLLATVFVTVLVGSAVSGCSNSSEQLVIHAVSGATMGTSYSVKVVAPKDFDQQGLKSNVQAVLDRIESRMSTYRKDSELSRFNTSKPGQWFDVTDETAKVVALGLTISQETQGAFDMTVGPLVNLWGFGPGKVISKAPTELQINNLLTQVGYDQIEVRQTPPSLFKHQDAYLDLSAIAKGYAVDAVADTLGSQFSAYLVEVGGELRAEGRKPSGENWRIAVESPVVETRDIQKVIKVEGTAIATSGDYRNYFEQDGVRYSHTIDPTTGKPIRHRLASVTVLDPSCGRADALATALMVLGEEKGLALAKSMKLPALFLVKQEQGFAEIITPEFEPFLIQ